MLGGRPRPAPQKGEYRPRPPSGPSARRRAFARAAAAGLVAGTVVGGDQECGAAYDPEPG